MLSQTLLIALAGAATVSALPGNMQERQVEDYAECATALQSAMKGMPTAPPALASFYVTQTETDFCSMTVPASLSSAYASMTSAAVSWYSANGDAISSALDKCPDMASLTQNMQIPTCTGGASSGNTSGGDSDDNDNASGSGNSENANDKTDGDDKKNAGHRDTGLAAAAVGIAAFIGVVAVL
ncbi:hypothetical protein B0I37DRAFT_73339 [Chaetomium sp. MPI-CAGE-AT-0009]|nr:hypothetical protein B0I37DRAFT_73339 [Chaetomium sp. MPI-CAGE-AT-0009]